MQGAGLAGIEFLVRIAASPDIEITDLRAFMADNAEEMPLRDIKTAGLARRMTTVLIFSMVCRASR